MGCAHSCALCELMHVGWRLVVAPNGDGAKQALLGFVKAQAEAVAKFASAANVLAVKGGAWVVVGKVLG